MSSLSPKKSALNSQFGANLKKSKQRHDIDVLKLQNSSFHKKKEKIRTDKTKFLTVGDIILLTNNERDRDRFDFVSSDGVISNRIDCIPESVGEKGANLLLRRCLFRIENARKIKQIMSDKDDPDLEHSIGKFITYGERIQLRHMHSRGYVTLDTEIAREPGCLKMFIDSKGTEMSWLEIVPINKLRREGEKVAYTDPIWFRAVSQQSPYYMHIYTGTMQNSMTDKVEVNCSHYPSQWKTRQYMSYEVAVENPSYVMTGDSFRIYSRISNGYLVADEKKIIDEEYNPELYVQRGNKTSSSLWELHREATFIGGIAHWSEQFRFRHLATGYFLAMEHGGVGLTYDQSKPSTLFTLQPDAENRELQIPFGAILSIIGRQMQSYICVDEEPREGTTKFGLKLTDSKSKYSHIAFVIEDVPENQTSHIYKLSLTLSAIEDFYQYVKVQDATQEKILIEESKKMKPLLQNLVSKIIFQDDSDLNMKKRQDAFREMGVIDALLVISQRIGELLKVRGDFRVDDLESQWSIVKLQQAIFAKYNKHLYAVLVEIFKTLTEIIQSHSSNCQRLYPDIKNLIFLQTLLSQNTNVREITVELGRIIREIFQFATDSENQYDDQVDEWFKKLKPRTGDQVIDELTSYIKTLSSLAQTRGVGQPQHQKHCLTQVMNDPIIKFWETLDKTAIDIRNDQMALFEKSIPNLSRIERSALDYNFKSTTRGSPSSFIFLEDLNSDEFVDLNNYISAVIRFYSDIALNRFNEGIIEISTTLGGHIDHVNLALTSNSIPLNIRAEYANLARVLYVDVDPHIPIAQRYSRCYVYTPSNQAEMSYEITSADVFETAPSQDLSIIVDAVKKFWIKNQILDCGLSDLEQVVSSRDRSHSKQYEDKLEELLYLSTCFLKLSNKLIELGIVESQDIEFLHSISALLVMTPKDTDPSTENWTSQMMQQAEAQIKKQQSISIEVKRSNCLLEVLNMLQVILNVRMDLQVAKILTEFMKIRTQSEDRGALETKDFTPKLMSQVKKALLILDFDVEERINYNPADLSWNEEKTYPLDLDLLKLVFNISKSQNKEVKRQALDVLIQNLNHVKLVRQEIEKVEFLQPKLKEKYDTIIAIKKKIEKKMAIIENGQDKSDKKKSDAYVDALASLIEQISDLNEILEKPDNQKYKKLKYQNMMRHTGLQNVICKFMTRYYHPSLNQLYKSLNICLFHFCQQNPINQDILLEYSPHFEKLIGERVNVNKLLAQVLSHRKREQSNFNSIRYILSKIEQSDHYLYQLLPLLKSYTKDSQGKYIKDVQIDVIKGIVNNKKIIDFYTSKSIQKQFYYEYNEIFEYKDEQENFHIEVMRCLIETAHNNKFAMLQCRQLIPPDKLLQQLIPPPEKSSQQIKTSKISYKVKKTMLDYLYHVYLHPQSTRVMDINELEDLFKQVIIPDLTVWKNSWEDETFGISGGKLLFLSVVKRGFYENVTLAKKHRKQVRQDRRASALNVKITHTTESEVPNTPESSVIEHQVRLTHHESQELEYWNYLSGGSTWHWQKTGLLHFITDVFSYARDVDVTDFTSQIGLEPVIIEFAVNIGDNLDALSAQLVKLQSEHPDLDFSNLLLVINSCREVLPKVDAPAAPKQGAPMSRKEARLAKLNMKWDTGEQSCLQAKEEGAEIDQILAQIRQYIIENRLSLEDAFDLFDANSDNAISEEEFTEVCEKVIGVTDKQMIETARLSLDKNADGTIDFLEFANKLSQFYKKRTDIQTGTDFEQISNTINTEFMSLVDFELRRDKNLKIQSSYFIEAFKTQCKDRDQKNLVKKVHEEYVERSIKDRDNITLKKFIQNLGTAFGKKNHKIYLISILTQLIKRNNGIPANQRKVQTVLAESGVIELTLGTINEAADIQIAYEGIKLLKHMLRGGNKVVQDQLLRLLRQHTNATFFTYIRSQLRQSRDRLVERANERFKIQTENLFYPDQSRLDDAIVLTSEERYLAKMVQNSLGLLQNCCYDCHIEFQNFIGEQALATELILRINMVNVIVQFLINIKEIGVQLTEDEEAQIVIPQCFETLIDLCRGPCPTNQYVLGQKRKLYQLINYFIDVDVTKIVEKKNFFVDSIRYLLVLLEGEFTPKTKLIAQIMIQEIDFEKLIEKAYDIYLQFIAPENYINLFMQERYENRAKLTDTQHFWDDLNVRQYGSDGETINEAQWKIIQSGFSIVILVLKLQSQFPWDKKLEKLGFHKEYREVRDLSKLIGRNSSIWVSLTGFIKQFCIRARYGKDNRPRDMNEAFKFYTSLISKVEIDRDGKLETAWFPVPPLTVYISNKSKRSVTRKIKETSHEEKIKSFVVNVEKYFIEMKHLQNIAHYRAYSWIASKGRNLGVINFWLVIIVNLLQLISVKEKDPSASGRIDNFETSTLLTIIGLLILLIAILHGLTYAWEKYPIILYSQLKSRTANKEKTSGSIQTKKLTDRNPETKIEMPNWERYMYLILHRNNLLNFAFIVLAIVAFELPYMYSFMLLYCLRISEVLRDVLKSVTINRGQIILTLILGLIIIYLFGIVAFLFFGEYYDIQENGTNMNTYCETLLECVTSTLQVGVRAGAGIGEMLQQPVIEDDNYWTRSLFDVLFFAVVIIILLNIIFGIIIDTFAELRDKKKETKRQLDNFCMMCGREKYEFEQHGNGWVQHISGEHDPHAYLSYLIYVRQKPVSQCDGLEKVVKKKIMLSDVSFFPKTAICLEGIQTEDDDPLSEIEQTVDGYVRKAEKLRATLREVSTENQANTQAHSVQFA